MNNNFRAPENNNFYPNNNFNLQGIYDREPENEPRNAEAEAALLAAVLAGNVAEIARISETMSPDTKLEHDRSALWHAVHAAKHESIRALIDAGASINNINFNSDGQRGSILVEAILMNNVPLVKLLLELGANPNSGDGIHHRPPLLAVFDLEKGEDRRIMLRTLVEGGADVDRVIRVEEPTHRAMNPHGRNIPIINSSPLIHFLHLGDKDAIYLLLDYGADPKKAVDGVTPLEVAEILGDKSISGRMAAFNRRKHALAALRKKTRKQKRRSSRRGRKASRRHRRST
jgi:ankyrin repeat protein